MNPEQLQTVLDDHQLWLAGEGGAQANLSAAQLSGANLSRANMQEVSGISVASCHWSGHGECGRQLLAVALPEGLRFYCGCFSGSAEELREYITTHHALYAPSRTKALEFLLSCFP